MSARDRAKNGLNHYIFLLLRKSGETPDWKTTVAIDAIVEDIIEATIEEIEKRPWRVGRS